jgi:nicotinamidase-related amidase
MKHNLERLIVIIDAQKAFCNVYGSLSLTFGQHELERIAERLSALEEFLVNYPNPRELCLVRSEYKPGQFTNGDLNNPYAHTCVPGLTNDCGWSLSDAALNDRWVITKTQESVASATGFMKELQAMAGAGLREVLIAGFLTTSCVRKTALEVRNSLSASVAVGVLESLSASRASNYMETSGGGISRHEAALEEMESAGVKILRSRNIPDHPVVQSVSV